MNNNRKVPNALNTSTTSDLRRAFDDMAMTSPTVPIPNSIGNADAEYYDEVDLAESPEIIDES